MYFYSYSLIILFFSGLFIYILKFNHFLLMLLSLEFIVLSLFLFLMFSVFCYSFEYFLCMFYLSMSVCESALGLSLLVLVVRSHGVDSIMLIDNLW
uniref:NADH-ubiquinone oxidoreductase chain 4L n=2 Tax=unclassified Curculionoidea TaxID=201752 RepID=A0A346RIU0_9CUCU|nr:NADH dehydrogenase subunit 4L [Curculionoidea sp. 6 KM-2017]AXS65997.1 NADH dehydrogenase subunit 4L [Curculionoidea sp. 5 KM-2017]